MATEIVRFRNYEVIPEIASIAMRKDVYKELKYPVFTGPNCSWIVAKINGETSGFLCVENKKLYYYFCHLYVVPEKRGLGIGTMLVANGLNDISGATPKTSASKAAVSIFMANKFLPYNETKNYCQMLRSSSWATNW